METAGAMGTTTESTWLVIGVPATAGALAVAGTVIGTWIGHHFQWQLQLHKEAHDAELERSRAEQAREAAQREQRLRSDAACWRRIWEPFQCLWWETETLLPQNKKMADGTWIHDPFVGAPPDTWIDKANAVNKAAASAAFYDPKAQSVLPRIHTLCAQVRGAAEVVAARGEIIRKQREAGLPAGDPNWRQVNDEAIRRMEEVRALFQEATAIIRDSVGFDRLWSAVEDPPRVP